MTERITIRATEVGGVRFDPARHPGYTRPKRSRWHRLKAILPTPTNIRRYRARVARERVFNRMLTKESTAFTPAENRRMRAAYVAEYEAWLTSQGFPTNLKHATALDPKPDLKPPLDE